MPKNSSQLRKGRPPLDSVLWGKPPALLRIPSGRPFLGIPRGFYLIPHCFMGLLDSFGKDAIQDIENKEKIMKEVSSKKSEGGRDLLYFLGLIAMGLAVAWLFGGGQLSPAGVGTIIGVAAVGFMGVKSDVATYKRKEEAKQKAEADQTSLRDRS